ncbi:hypothetical protein ACFYP4_02610 [Streptomyces sp. NPDC005551]|uniref:hypothetical protein n=1 Tax=Streptomyces sp. NPDC005551 TaxID=3364725 RepID=UPI0036A0586C
MGRADWKRGRWSPEVETQAIADGLRGYQPQFGDEIAYFRYDFAHSVKHNVYDEAAGPGRAFKGPVAVPALSVVHSFGGDTLEETGFYTNDEIEVVCGFRQLGRTGLSHADLRNERYLRDRLAYDGKLFRVLAMSIRGQIVRSDVVATIRATQLKPDEISNDVLFAQYAVSHSRLGHTEA